jgi:hypothetical protein
MRHSTALNIRTAMTAVHECVLQMMEQDLAEEGAQLLVAIHNVFEDFDDVFVVENVVAVLANNLKRCVSVTLPSPGGKKTIAVTHA